MAVRSIKLKLKTNSGENSLKIRLGVWKTHRLLNEGVAYYMNWLCLLRQEPYIQKDVEREQQINKEDVQRQLISKFREQQQNNQWIENPGEDTEILPLLRQLYELIVPSSMGGNGDAQMLSRKFLSPLVDPDSQGGKGISKAGRKPRWLKMQEEGDPDWQQEYEKDKARKEVDPTASILNSLESFGLKPLFGLFTDTKKEIQWLPKQSRQFVRTWDRDMFQQAIERMLSWESWNRRVKDEREKLEQKAQEFYNKYLAEDNDWLDLLRTFEEKRHTELAGEALEPIEKYVITKRQIRGWDRLYDKWKRMPQTANDEQLWRAVSDLQTKLKGEFGDHKVFRFLTERKNRCIWQGHPERLYHFAAYNGLIKKLNRSKEQAAFTLPDPVNHPLWIRYDARGGNIHSYTIELITHKQYNVKFASMIWPENDGWIEKRDIELSLAPSKQFYRQIKLADNPNGRQEVQFWDYSSQVELKGTLGGAKIQFDRRHIEKKSDRIESGEIGPVYLNLVVDLEPITEIKNGRLQSPLGQALKVVTTGTEFPKVVGFEPDKLLNWIQSSPVKDTIGTASLTEGMRVMSVDMGQRTSAAVSIFEIIKEQSEQTSKISYPIGDTGLAAIHRRSLLLNLPGEGVSKNILKKREKRWQQYLSVKSQIKMLSKILKLNKYTSVQERQEAIQALLENVDNSFFQNEHKLEWRKILSLLVEHKEVDPENWKKLLESSHLQLEALVGEIVSLWRKSLTKNEIHNNEDKKKSDRRGIAGISIWNIKELEDTRKLLVSWSKHSQTPGTINRINRNEKFGQKLLNHIQNVKDDRLKQMTNLIVMTALGYKYQGSGKTWIAKYPACQLILFENLQGYKLDQERSRRENAKLMTWAHRSIPKLAYMQGEMYGIQVGDVYAAYSSRYHAKTGAPGIRCHALTVEDINTLKEKRYHLLVDEKFLEGTDVNKFKPGDLLPSRGGELFVTLNGPNSKDLTMIHADINAAQNLHRRFWQQNNEVFRVPCQLAKAQEGDIYIPKTESKKIKTILGKGCFIQDTLDKDVYYWQKNPKINLKRISVRDNLDFPIDEELDDYQEMVEEALEITGEYKTLLRDPSGYFFPSDCWLPQKEFWGRVNSVIKKLLRENKH